MSSNIGKSKSNDVTSRFQRDTAASERIPAITSMIHPHPFAVFPDSLKPFKSGILAYSASNFSTIVGFPLDTLKTRMQTYRHFNGYADCVSKTFALEGARGFFRGIWAPLLSTSLSKSFSISIFVAIKPYTYKALYDTSAPLKTKAGEYTQILRNFPVSFISGAVSGGCVSLFACPFEFIKIYAQLQALVKLQNLAQFKSLVLLPHTSTHSIARLIISREGYAGLYLGFRFHLMRDSMSTAIYYSVYESVKWILNTYMVPDGGKGSQISVLIAGGMSGVFCWTLIFPLDTRKSLVQKNIVSNILRKQVGLEPEPLVRDRNRTMFSKNLYRGLGILVTRTFFVNMVFFGVYESLMSWLV